MKNYRDLGAEGREWLAAAESRYNKSVYPVFYVAFSLHPACAKDLSEAEWARAMDWVKKERPFCFEFHVEFIGGNKDKIDMFKLTPSVPLANFYMSQEHLGKPAKRAPGIGADLVEHCFFFSWS